MVEYGTSGRSISIREQQHPKTLTLQLLDGSKAPARAVSHAQVPYFVRARSR